MTTTFQILAISALLIIASVPNTQCKSLRILESASVALRNLQLGNIQVPSAIPAPAPAPAPILNSYLNSQTHVYDYGTGNVVVGGTILVSGNATVVVEITGSYNSIGQLIIIGSQYCQVRIQVIGDHNIISGLTITCSDNAVLNFFIQGSQNSVGGLTLSISNDAQFYASITGQSNNIADGTITASDSSYQIVQLNSLNQLNQCSFTTTSFSRSQVLLTGSSNQVNRLKISGSGTSYLGFNMPNDGETDNDRNMPQGSDQNEIIFVPEQ